MNQTTITIQRIAIAIQCGVPLFLLGKPGVAKTAIAVAIARSLGMPYITKIGSQHDPTDFGGMPWVGDEGYVEMKPLKWAHEFSEARLGDKPALIFVDELPLAPKSTQDAMLRMINEGYVGDVKLGSRVARVAAGNDPQVSNTPPMSPMLVNRFCVLEFDMEVGYWAHAAMNDFPDPVVPRVPNTWQDYLPEFRAYVVSYLERNPTDAHKMPADESLWGKPWPSFRSWELAARLLAATKAAGLGMEVSLGLVGGCIGSGSARAFLTYLEQLDLPDPKTVLANPDKIDYPTRGDQLYALVTAVSGYAIANASNQMWTNAWRAIEHAAKIKKDIAAHGGRLLSKAYGEGRFGTNPPTPFGALELFPTLKLAGSIQHAKTPAVA